MLISWSLAVGLAACSDSKPKVYPDARVVDSAVADSAAGDLGNDGAVIDAHSIFDGFSDAADGALATDGGLADGSPRDTTSDGPTPGASVWGYISRSVKPVFDANGTVFISVHIPLLPPPAPGIQTATVQAVLTQDGSKAKYEIFGLSSGSYLIAAFLDDNANAFPLFPGADPGDLVMSKAVSITSGATPVRQDLVLDQVFGTTTADGGPGDATITTGGIQGSVSATAPLVYDGKGTVFLSLYSQPPPAGLVGIQQVNSADLSSQFAREKYFWTSLSAGNYYLTAFLDDNGDANPLFGAVSPNKGDLATKSPVQVRVVAGQTTSYDIVLDVTTP